MPKTVIRNPKITVFITPVNEIDERIKLNMSL